MQASGFQPPTKVNGGAQIEADRQRSVADRRHLGGEAFKIRSRTPSIHVTGLRQKFRNLHVVLSAAGLGSRLKTTLCRAQTAGAMAFDEAELESWSPP